MTFYAWKFVVPSGTWAVDPEDPSLSHQGCLAVAVAPDEEAARKQLALYAREFGFDSRWLRAAKVSRLDLTGPATLCWAQV